MRAPCARLFPESRLDFSFEQVLVPMAMEPGAGWRVMAGGGGGGGGDGVPMKAQTFLCVSPGL